jgi:hypothetical protein
VNRTMKTQWRKLSSSRVISDSVISSFQIPLKTDTHLLISTSRRLFPRTSIIRYLKPLWNKKTRRTQWKRKHPFALFSDRERIKERWILNKSATKFWADADTLQNKRRAIRIFVKTAAHHDCS